MSVIFLLNNQPCQNKIKMKYFLQYLSSMLTAIAGQRGSAYGKWCIGNKQHWDLPWLGNDSCIFGWKNASNIFECKLYTYIPIAQYGLQIKIMLHDIIVELVMDCSHSSHPFIACYSINQEMCVIYLKNSMSSNKQFILTSISTILQIRRGHAEVRNFNY